MREQFDKQLAKLRQDLISIYAQIDLELHDAVESLVKGDKAQAKKVKKATREIDGRCAELEDRAYNLIVLQNPVASDLRLLQFIIYVNFNLARMSNHVRNIAKTTKRCAGHNVPGQLLDLLASQAHLVYRVLGATVQAVVDNDLAEAAELPELDRPVDSLYKSFYRTFSKLDADDDIDAASRVIMAARMLERISDNSVEVGERLVFLLTGSRESLDDLSDLDDDELDGLYVPTGAPLTMGRDKVEHIANKIPEIVIGTSQAIPMEALVAADTARRAKADAQGAMEAARLAQLQAQVSSAAAVAGGDDAPGEATTDGSGTPAVPGTPEDAGSSTGEE